MVRSSLGRAVLADSGGLAEEYPYYGISVPDFLELTEWLPHEALKASGKVKQMGETDEVIFVSHQWTSFSHPDPAGNQLRALQTQIRTLMKGKTAVRSDSALDGSYGYSMVTAGKEWKNKLPNMYLWVDYCSIPQPSAAGGGVHAAQHSDHREGQGDLVAQLKQAVNSIPSYLARSTMMWVLVPPVKHESLDGAICDYNSWRRRGWCRLEFAASKLCAGDDMPCMVITSATATPEYCCPCDIFKLCAGNGDFTVDSDRDAVNSTLTKMLQAKVEGYAKKGDITLSRMMQAMSPVFVPRHAYGSAAVGSEGAAIDRLKTFMKWRSDAEEEAWMAETGWNLLTFAAAMDDGPAIEELLSQDAATVERLFAAKGTDMVCPGNSKKGTPLRREPLGQKLLEFAKDMTPMIAATTFGSRAVCEKLMDAGGAAAARDGLKLLGARPCLFRGAIVSGKHENVKLVLERYPHIAEELDPEFGTCVLHMACGTTACRGQSKVMKELLACPGAVEKLNSVNSPIFGSVLGTACSFQDQDPETVRLLLEAGADPSKPEVLHPIAVQMRKKTAIGKFLGNVQARGYHHLFSTLPGRFKQSPTHIATQQGDLAKIKVLAEHEKFPVAQYKDTKGRTPVALCVEDTVKTAVAELVGPAAVATQIPGNKVAPEQ